MALRVRVGNTVEVARLARRLRSAANGGLQRDLTTQIRREGRPVLAEVRRTVRALEITSTKGGTARPDTSTGLRRRLASATTMEDHGVGVRFEVHGARVGPYGHRLAKLSDTELAPRWRHPVFAHPERESVPWVQQWGKPWFFVTIRGAEPRFAEAVRRAIRATARKIMG